MIPLTTITLGAVSPEEMASAAGLQNFLRTMAVAIATSLVLTVWGDAQRTARTDIVSRLQPDEVQRTLSNSGMSADQSRMVISNIVDQEAIIMAINYTFWIAAFVLVCSALLIWFTPKVKAPVDTSAVH